MAVPERNQQLAALFRSIAELLAAQRANPYRVRAYRRGADTLLALDEDVADVAQRHALEEIDGIGSDLSQKIEEFLRTGKILTLETLRMPLPDAVKGWARLPGLSESLVAYLYSRLNIASLADLEKLVRSHMLRTMPGFSGSEETLLQAIEELRRRST
jgi:DNA polymerase (family X)